MRSANKIFREELEISRKEKNIQNSSSTKEEKTLGCNFNVCRCPWRGEERNRRLSLLCSKVTR